MREQNNTASYGVATANGFAMPHRARGGVEENATYRKIETPTRRRSPWGRFASLFRKPQPAVPSVLRF
jgi:hypothetical protein